MSNFLKTLIDFVYSTVILKRTNRNQRENTQRVCFIWRLLVLLDDLGEPGDKSKRFIGIEIFICSKKHPMEDKWRRTEWLHMLILPPFLSVSQEALLDSLKKAGAGAALVEIVRNQFNGATTKIRTDKGYTDPMEVRHGIKQE